MSDVQRHPLVGCRSDLAMLSNLKGGKIGVEVGTDRGIFAAEFLRKWSGEILYCVDLYEPYREMPWDRTGDFMSAVTLLANELHRVRFVRAPSANVARFFTEKLVGWPDHADIVYIDGAHDKGSVAADLMAWWPVVKEGGIFAGHDWTGEHPGVREAVEEFARTVGYPPIRLTSDYNQPISWFIEK